MDIAKVVSTRDRLYDRLDGEILKFVIAGDVFLAFSSSDTTKGCAGVYRIAALEADLQAILQEARGRTGGSRKPVVVKMIGPAAKITALAKLMASPDLMVTSATATNGRAEVFYYPSQNRVRVSTAAIAAAAEVAIPRPKTVALDVREPKPRRIRVAIVDDSKTIRMLLRSILADDESVEVIWEASRPSEALRLLDTAQPDVLTLDLHMPEMNGVELLKAYIDKYPIPTVIISSLSKDESPLVLDALESGAIDYIQKPDAKDLGAVRSTILEKVKDAAQAKIPSRKTKRKVARLAQGAVDQGIVIAIGASTGGTEALKDVLIQLPGNIPPIVIVQHIPPVFSLAFANRLNSLCPFEVKEAEDGDVIAPGRVLIAPGAFHMVIKKFGSTKKVAIIDADPVNRHKPSVDVLFDSVAEHLGPNAIGVILTGMGGDGAKGLLKMKEAGARTVAQDEAGCVVFGMPREAIRLGAAQKIAALADIPRVIMSMVSSTSGSTKSVAAK